MSTIQYEDEQVTMDEKTTEHREPLLPSPAVASDSTTVKNPYKNYFFVFINGAATVAVVFLNKM